MSKKNLRDPHDLKSIELTGFKSIAKKTKVNFSFLTIFSGANSSGKSSVSQAILLLKQTNEAPYDPGAILLNGPNVKLTSAKHVLSQLSGIVAKRFVIKFNFENQTSTELSYKYSPSKPGALDIDYIQEWQVDGAVIKITQGSSSEDLLLALTANLPKELKALYVKLAATGELKPARDKCFYNIGLYNKIGIKSGASLETQFGFNSNREFLNKLIHVPGLRGNPERTYATTATTSGNFPGRFETYVASLVRNWEHDDTEKFLRLSKDLVDLGLTSEIKTERIDDTQVEIKVSRFKYRSNEDSCDHMVSIADVGFGVSQVLPILVALHAAQQGQYVIVEQPELHLHPKAQSKLAAVLAEAINRGVRIIIETHSNILLQGIQTLVAKGEINNGEVALNWFETTSDGYTKVNSGALDKIGAFGDWPADFMDIQIESEASYLDAVEKVMFPKLHNEK
jgi:predicted ATPase